MIEKQLLTTLLKDRSLNIKTRNFLSDLLSKLDKFGSLTDSQLKALGTIANAKGLSNKTSTSDAGPVIIEKISGSCGQCVDGIITATENSAGGFFAFVCPCSVGNKRSESFPVWNEIKFGEYFSIDSPGTRNDESIYSPEDIKEIMDFARDVMAGKRNKLEAYQFCKMLDRSLRDRGITPAAWEHMHDDYVKSQREY